MERDYRKRKKFTTIGEYFYANANEWQIFTRISRGRRTVENFFGLLSTKWRCLRKPLEVDISTADHIIRAICCLHNFLLEHSKTRYNPRSLADMENGEHNFIPGRWREITRVFSILF